MEIKNLIAVKRVRPLLCSYIENPDYNAYVNSINFSIKFYRYFTTKIEIQRCDVFKVRFDQGFGSELRGYHYVVSMQSSRENNQTVTIVPLSSFKEVKRYNSRSTVFIGEIEDLPNSKGSVALINQIRTIDKMRLYGENAISQFIGKFGNKIKELPEESLIQPKKIYRLTKEQYNKILHAVNNYLFYGAVERKQS